MTDFTTYEFSSREKQIFYCVLVLSGLALSILYYQNAAFTVIIISLRKRIKKSVLNYIIEKRKRKFLEEFKDFLFILSTSISAGRAMKEAISEAIPSVEEIYRNNSILAPELREIENRLNFGNEDDVGVLTEFAVKTGITDVIDFVMVYSTCKVTGASLITALNKAASVIIDKMTIDKEIRELVRRKEIEGMFIFIMPVIVIIVLNISAADYIEPLYSSIQGRLIMTAAIISNFSIYEIIRKITTVEI